MMTLRDLSASMSSRNFLLGISSGIFNLFAKPGGHGVYAALTGFLEFCKSLFAQLQGGVDDHGLKDDDATLFNGNVQMISVLEPKLLPERDGKVDASPLVYRDNHGKPPYMYGVSLTIANHVILSI